MPRTTTQSSEDKPPSVPSIFPLWYRLNKIKQLLPALNGEVAALVQRIPPPPALSKHAKERSEQFARAIRRRHVAPIDNIHLVAAMRRDNSEAEDDPSYEQVLAKLQAAFNESTSGSTFDTYGNAIHQITLEAMCRHLVPALHEVLQATNEISIDVLRLLRLIHSITCCDGMQIRSVVKS